jgi:hypothetical protein
MFEAGHFIAAQETGEPGELDGPVDRESGEEAAETHADDRGIGDLLGGVVLTLRWRTFGESYIVERNLDGVAGGAQVGNQFAPFAREDGVENVEEAVDGEQPHEAEMHGHAEGELVIEVEGGIERVGEEVEEGELTQTDAVDVVGPVDQDAAPDHDGEEGEVDPVGPAGD